MKRLFVFIFLFAIILCSSCSEKAKNKPVKSAGKLEITNENIKHFFKKPSDFANYTITETGAVEKSVYIDKKGVYTTVLLYPNEYSGEIMLVDEKATKPLKQQSTIEFTGFVKGSYETENKFGIKKEIPRVASSSIDVVDTTLNDQKELKTITFNEEKNVGNIHSMIEKIVLFDKSTRVYLFNYNKTDKRIYFNDALLQLFADGVLIPSKFEVIDESHRLARSLEPNTGTHGILTFNKVPLTTKKLVLKFVINKRDDSKGVPIQFEVKMNE